MRAGLAYGGSYFMPLSTATSKGCGGVQVRTLEAHPAPVQGFKYV